MVKLPVDQQALFLRSEPDVYEPAAGAWGRQGCTLVCLSRATVASVRQALVEAWRRAAPKRLVRQLGEE
jgi:hypothetical protein